MDGAEAGAGRPRPTEIYNEKKAAPQSQTKAERIKKYGAMRFEEYTNEWKTGQRDLAEAPVRHLDSLLEHHIFPTPRSRRMNTFDHKVVDGFIQTMERNRAGLATQSNAYDKRLRRMTRRVGALEPVRQVGSGDGPAVRISP
jgi:hypothetical protein